MDGKATILGYKPFAGPALAISVGKSTRAPVRVPSRLSPAVNPLSASLAESFHNSGVGKNFVQWKLFGVHRKFFTTGPRKHTQNGEPHTRFGARYTGIYRMGAACAHGERLRCI